MKTSLRGFSESLLLFAHSVITVSRHLVSQECVEAHLISGETAFGKPEMYQEIMYWLLVRIREATPFAWTGLSQVQLLACILHRK